MTLEEAILKALSEKTGIPVISIQSRTRKREIITCRQIGYYLYRKVYGSSVALSMCSELLFNLDQDHTTVMHAIRAAENYIQNEKHIRMLSESVKDRVDELLKQPPQTKPINEIMRDLSESLQKVIQVIPYNNCASF